MLKSGNFTMFFSFLRDKQYKTIDKFATFSSHIKIRVRLTILEFTMKLEINLRSTLLSCYNNPYLQHSETEFRSLCESLLCFLKKIKSFRRNCA